MVRPDPPCGFFFGKILPPEAPADAVEASGGSIWAKEKPAGQIQGPARRRRSAFVTTKTELSAMAAAASMGESIMPLSG